MEIKNPESSNEQHIIDVKKISTSVRAELEKLDLLSDECCIYEVPDRLRKLNEKAYTPRVVSIGPIHHGKMELQIMEGHKKRYMLDFIKSYTESSLEELVGVVKENERRLRSCYAEAVKLTSEDFIKMILTDASFIIVFLLRYYLSECASNDRIHNKPWMVLDIQYDVLLLENQLPFFILEELFDLSVVGRIEDGNLSMIQLAQSFLATGLGTWVTEDSLKRRNLDRNEAEHFVHLLWLCQQPKESRTKGDIKSLIVPSITELKHSGVEFKSSSSILLVDMKFADGVLEIPCIQVDDQTETILRNLQAYEQLHCSNSYIGESIAFLNLLLNDPGDVEILVEKRIIDNWLPSNQDLSNLLRNLSKGNIVGKESYFGQVSAKLIEHSKVKWHKWKVNLKQDYFNTPWATVSVVAAGFLILLTVIQTVCALLQINVSDFFSLLL